MSLLLRPISIRDAKALVAKWHRHHPKPQGAKVAIAAAVKEGNTYRIVSVAMIGRPNARVEEERNRTSDKPMAEVIRVATDGYPNACSFLYTRAKRAAQAIGYVRVTTKTLEEESGASLFGAGWEDKGVTDGGSWDRPSRPRTDKHPTGPKRRWEAA